MNNMPTLETKGGLKFKTLFTTTISASDVVNYLTNDVLQLPVKVSLRTIHGAGKGCYVITILSNGANRAYKKDIIDKIVPFKFPTPEQFALSMRNRETAQKLADIGIWGNTLRDINFFSDFRESKQTGFHVIYLDTEKIIKQMAEDPLENKIQGQFEINAVYGEKDEAIRWDVSIKAGMPGNVGNRPFNVTIDKIIATAR